MSITNDVLAVIDGPRCAREIAAVLGVSSRTVSTALRRLVERQLVRVVTPWARQARLYVPTVIGRALRHEQWGAAEPRSVAWDSRLLELYRWIQAGRHRRAVLVALTEPMSPQELYRRLADARASMGMSHLYAVLRVFSREGLAVQADRLWRPTPLADRLRMHVDTCRVKRSGRECAR